MYVLTYEIKLALLPKPYCSRLLGLVINKNKAEIMCKI